MDHRGQIQIGGQESGEPWVGGWCRLTEDRVSFFVNEVEVLAVDRDTASIVEEASGVFSVGPDGEPFFFHPTQREGFVLDLSGDALTAAEKVKLAQTQAPAASTHGSTVHVAPKSRLAAGLLAIFLGGIGAHKFYLGEVGMGVLYLIFAWTVIPAVIGFIEGIIYLTMTDEAFTAKYG